LKDHAAIRARRVTGTPSNNTRPAVGGIEARNDSKQRRFAASRWSEDREKSLSATASVVGCSAFGRRAAAHARKSTRSATRSRAYSFDHGNNRRLTHLNRKSEINPMMPITMMPKIIWPY
jgi:hypothetical protein